MKRKKVFGWIGVIGILFFLGADPAAAQGEEAGIEVRPVAGSVYMLTGPGGNIGASVGQDGMILVDDKFSPMSDTIREALEKLGPGEVRFVLNTHWHHDHTGGNENFGRTSTIIAHENVRKRLSTRQISDFLNRTSPPMPDVALPVITFREGLTLHFNDDEIDVIHFPAGHTDGDSIVIFTDSNVVHMGDLFFNGFFPYVDLSAGGTVRGYLANVEAVLSRLSGNVQVIPGHGRLGNLEDVKTFHEMLTGTISFIEEQMGQGMTLTEIQEKGLPSQWEGWGDGFISEGQWIELVYTSLTQEDPTQ